MDECAVLGLSRKIQRFQGSFLLGAACGLHRFMHTGACLQLHDPRLLHRSGDVDDHLLGCTLGFIGRAIVSTRRGRRIRMIPGPAAPGGTRCTAGLRLRRRGLYRRVNMILRWCGA